MKRVICLLALAGSLAEAGMVKVVTYPVRHPVRSVRTVLFPVLHPARTVRGLGKVIW